MKLDLSHTEVKLIADTFLGGSKENVDLQVKNKLLEVQVLEAGNKLHAKERELSDKLYKSGLEHEAKTNLMEEKIANLQGQVDASTLAGKNAATIDPMEWVKIMGPLLRCTRAGLYGECQKKVQALFPTMNAQQARTLAEGNYKEDKP